MPVSAFEYTLESHAATLTSIRVNRNRPSPSMPDPPDLPAATCLRKQAIASRPKQKFEVQGEQTTGNAVLG